MKSHNIFCGIHGLISRKIISSTRLTDVWSYLIPFLLAEGIPGFLCRRREEQAVLGMQLSFNSASFPVGLTKMVSYSIMEL